MRWYSAIRSCVGLAPYTDEEYLEATTENQVRENVRVREALDVTNDASIVTSEKVRLRVARRKWELDLMFRHLAQSKQSAEDAADLLRKIVEGPS